MTALAKALALPRGTDLARDWLPACDAALAELVRERIANETRRAELADEAGRLALALRRTRTLAPPAAPANEPAAVAGARALVQRLTGKADAPAPAAAPDPTPARLAAIRDEIADLEAAHGVLADAERVERRRVAAAIWPKVEGEYRRAASALVAAIAELARRHRDFDAINGPLRAAGAIPNDARLVSAEAVGDALAGGPAAGALARFADEAMRAGLGATDATPLFAA
jgi:hypothetical protein